MPIHLVTRGLGRLRSLLASTWGLGNIGTSVSEPYTYQGRAVTSSAVCSATLGQAQTSALCSHAAASATTSHASTGAIVSSNSTSAITSAATNHG